MASSSFPNLDGLTELARRDGVDISPTLVRVLTDLYVQKRAHTPEEEHHYTELALRLLEAVDVPTRAAVARKLAAYKAAPSLVISRLARDVLEVAEPVLRHSPCLTGFELLAIISEFGPRYAAVIAERDSAAWAGRRAVAAAPAEPAEANAAVAAVDAPAARPVAPDVVPDIAPPPGVPATQPVAELSVGEVFFKASSSQRRAILANLKLTDAHGPTGPMTTAGEAAIGRLEAAALQRRPDDFVRELELALAIPAATAAGVVADESGELAVVALKALGMPSDVLLRVILFLNPVVGQSVPRVFELSTLYERLTVAAAEELVAGLRRGPRPQPAPARHQPQLWDDEAAARRGGEPARRGPAPPRPLPATRPDTGTPARPHTRTA